MEFLHQRCADAARFGVRKRSRNEWWLLTSVLMLSLLGYMGYGRRNFKRTKGGSSNVAFGAKCSTVAGLGGNTASHKSADKLMRGRYVHVWTGYALECGLVYDCLSYGKHCVDIDVEADHAALGDVVRVKLHKNGCASRARKYGPRLHLHLSRAPINFYKFCAHCGNSHRRNGLSFAT